MTRSIAVRILLDLGLKTPRSKLNRSDGLTDPKDPFRERPRPKSYKLKPTTPKLTPKPTPKPLVEEEALPLPQASPYGPRHKARQLSAEAVKAAADRAAAARKD